ncbi:von Willebrand factor A domain-containing protein 7 [Labeo rohita]|uniref:von Willebrand factor A domain-containing protein 7 n=1 Tax=Labeo rohita TaxID=84645 RepID=A0ABQ8MVM4_LABRO|nr:von Willebrand factor A domain-containing protein 7 [Labeo rohita]KAI2666895.1 von Willebrand factor A domain-containing protein 7 [Labeo rohita]
MRGAFLLLALMIGVQTFHTREKSNSKNHQDITKLAILRATAEVCKSAEGFTEPEPLNAQTLAKACKKDAFKSNFETGIKMITHYNTQTNIAQRFTPKYHFNNEKFLDGKAVIIKGIEDITADMKKANFENARKTLGTILHTLQDFYSHSNWIELGNTEPCTALINLEESIPNPADENTETCESNIPNTKTGAKFKDNVVENKILTSGYFGKMNKKKGKCSHGGTFDFSTGIGRGWDGINKDAIDSSHGLDHHKAADMAVTASVQLLDKIWKNNDDPSFFRLMGLDMTKPKGKWKTFFGSK